MDEALSESFSGLVKLRSRDPRPGGALQGVWAAAVHQLYVEARSFTHPQAQRRRTAQLAWERQLLVIGQPFLAGLQGGCRISRKLAEPGPDNKAQPHGITRSEQGTESKSPWRARGMATGVNLSYCD